MHGAGVFCIEDPGALFCEKMYKVAQHGHAAYHGRIAGCKEYGPPAA